MGCFVGSLRLPEDFALTILVGVGKGLCWLLAAPKPLSQKVCMCGCCLTLGRQTLHCLQDTNTPAFFPTAPCPQVWCTASGLSFSGRVQCTLCTLNSGGATFESLIWGLVSVSDTLYTGWRCQRETGSGAGPWPSSPE